METQHTAGNSVETRRFGCCVLCLGQTWDASLGHTVPRCCRVVSHKHCESLHAGQRSSEITPEVGCGIKPGLQQGDLKWYGGWMLLLLLPSPGVLKWDLRQISGISQAWLVTECILIFTWLLLGVMMLLQQCVLH